jgi:dCMP deaminase
MAERFLEEGAIGKRPSWDEYFMALAIVIASRSSCKHVKSGSVLTQDRQIVGTGYNGAAPGIEENCLDAGCRKEAKGLAYENSLGSGECIGIHSEMNALGNLNKRRTNGVTLYTTIFPCHSCAKNLMPYDVERVIYKSAYSKGELSSTLELFELGNVEIDRLDLSPERFVDILFGRPGEKFDIWPPEQRALIEKIRKQ